MNRLAKLARIVRIQGFYRTGTYWLQNLLKKNMPDAFVTHWTLGSKHLVTRDPHAWLASCRAAYGNPRTRFPTELFPPELDALEQRLDDVTAAVIVKHPFAWAASFMRYKPRFAASADPQPVISFSNRYAAWLQQAREQGWAIVRYIDLLADTEREVRRIYQELTGQPLETYTPVDNVVDRHGRVLSQSFSRHEYYFKAQYMDDLTPEIESVVREHTAWNVFKEYGYDVDPPKRCWTDSE